MAELGIAIITYRRLPILQATIRAVKEHTRRPFQLVVAEDGGEDGSLQWCRDQGIPVVTGPNRGIAWNKNRGLFALAAFGCDPIIVMEDDCRPDAPGWEEDWVEATRRWHHVSFAHKRAMRDAFGGAGTPEDPWVSRRSSAQCATISAKALATVGYFDPRFVGWGYEHKDWTGRLIRSGFGSREIRAPAGTQYKGRPIPPGTLVSGKLYMVGGLVAPRTPSSRNPEAMMVNKGVMRAVKGEPVRRPAWSNDAEKQNFLAEQEEAGIPIDRVDIVALEQPAASD